MTEVRDMTAFVVANARAVAWKTTAPRFLGGKRARLALDMLTISDLWHTEVFYTNLNHSEAPVQQRFCCRYFLLVEMFLVHFDSLS